MCCAAKPDSVLCWSLTVCCMWEPDSVLCVGTVDHAVWEPWSMTLLLSTLKLWSSFLTSVLTSVFFSGQQDSGRISRDRLE